MEIHVPSLIRELRHGSDAASAWHAALALDAEQRLAIAVLALADTSRAPVLEVTQGQLAEYAGCSRSYASTLLTMWARAGTVARIGRRTEIRDVRWLERLARWGRR